MMHSIIQITFKKKIIKSFVNLIDVQLSEEVGYLMFFSEMYKLSNSKLFDVEQKREVICPS